MKTATIAFVCFAAVLFVTSAFAGLVSVPLSNFGPGTIHELFNEPVDYSNAVQSPNKTYTNSLVVIGTNYSYALGNSNASLISPIPNVVGPSLPMISVAAGNQDFDFGTYGELMEGSGLIPGGAARKFLFETGQYCDHYAPYKLSFSGNGVTQVGGYWMMSGGGQGHDPSQDRIVVTAYGISGNLLGTIDFLPTDVHNWANNFGGFATDNGALIKTIGIDYSDNFGAANPAIANLMFNYFPGDANCDGTVNGADLNIVLANYNQTGMNWFQGDFDGNGTVNGADLNTVLTNYNLCAGVSASVPEPPTFVLALIGILVLFSWLWFSGLLPIHRNQ